ncbi:MAG: MBL fold metallo-hydrolase, partial [Planctomycetaceae bacterium]|nr:MBL fold metallo-hydrolase [Planctomycetaceae bacterium]
LFNPALQFHDEQEFVDSILADQPETPFYFAVMKRVNKVGPVLIGDLPPVKSPDPQLLPSIARKGLTIDTTPAEEFAAAHVPGTINVPVNMLAQWAGFLVDYDKPLHLVADSAMLPDILRRLRSIGIDNVCGSFDAAAVKASGLRTECYRSEPPQQLRQRIDDGEVQVLDVRAATEFHDGRIPGAEHRFLGKLLRELGDIDRSRPIVAHCFGGGRSAIATSILQRAGFDVTNMAGGYKAWVAAGLPVTNAQVRHA